MNAKNKVKTFRKITYLLQPLMISINCEYQKMVKAINRGSDNMWLLVKIKMGLINKHKNSNVDKIFLNSNVILIVRKNIIKDNCSVKNCMLTIKLVELEIELIRCINLGYPIGQFETVLLFEAISK